MITVQARHSATGTWGERSGWNCVTLDSIESAIRACLDDPACYRLINVDGGILSVTHTDKRIELDDTHFEDRQRHIDAMNDNRDAQKRLDLIRAELSKTKMVK